MIIYNKKGISFQDFTLLATMIY